MSKKVKMVLYAEPGVGKSTFASKAGHPFFICTDGNFEWLNLPEEDHIQVFSWEEALKVFDELNSEKYAQYDTIVIDLIEDLFKWCEQEYCKKNKISHMSDLGYGKAYDETRNEFYIAVSKVLGLSKHVIFLTHGLSKIEKDRRGVENTKYIPSNRIPDKVWDLIEGRVRYFLRAYVKGEENEDGKMIKRRYLSIIPKENEYGIARGIDEAITPEDIELDWGAFTTVIGVEEEPKKVIKTQPKPEPIPTVNREIDLPSPHEIKVEIPIKAEEPVQKDVVEEIVTTVESKPEPKIEVEKPTTVTPVVEQPVTREKTQAEKIAEIKAKFAAIKNK